MMMIWTQLNFDYADVVADAPSNDSHQWPSLGRYRRAGELAKEEEMHEGECLQVDGVHRFIQNCFGQNTQKRGGMQIWGGHFRGMKNSEKFLQIQQAPEINHNQQEKGNKKCKKRVKRRGKD